MVENAITKVARIAAHAAQGLVYKDSAGKEQTILPTGDKNMIDISGLSIGSGSGGDNGDSNHPNVGNDYYPGSVYDGTISGRTLLYSGVTSTTEKTNIVFPESVGAGLRLLGDGIQIRLKLLKTLVTRGVVDTTSTEIPLIYDILDKQVKGSFVTIAPLPASITKDNILSGNELVIPLYGIGEGEQSAEVKSPEMHLQYDSKTNSVNAWPVQGYALDNLTDTKTGTLYDIQITLINNFYSQESVAQLPTSMSLFSGDTDGDVKLTGINTFFDNVGSSIQVTLDKYIDLNVTGATDTNPKRIALSTLGIPLTYNISREDLILGMSVPMNSNLINTFSEIPLERYSNSSWSATTTKSLKPIVINTINPFILIGSGTINAKLSISFSTDYSRAINYDGGVKITSVITNN